MTGILEFVSSTRPAVFQTPLEVTFINRPAVGSQFVFTDASMELSHTSTVQAIDSENGEYLLKTRNSIYRLKETN